MLKSKISASVTELQIDATVWSAEKVHGIEQPTVKKQLGEGRVLLRISHLALARLTERDAPI